MRHAGSTSISGPVLVTGATGFIGSRLVKRLLDRGLHVRALVMPGERTEDLWPTPPPELEVVRGDVTRRRDVERAVSGVGTVMHLAAVVGDWGEESLFEQVTVGGTENVLEAAPTSARVVVASSIVVYGDSLGRHVCDEDRPFGAALGAYSRSKQRQELLALRVARRRGLSLTALRLANVYGPGSRPWVTEVLIQLRSGLPSLLSGGQQDAGLCFVDHAVDAFVSAAATPAAAGRVYNIADEGGVTWARYFGDLARLVSAPAPRSLPLPLAKAAATGSELAWRLLRRGGRPPLTHEALNLVGSHHRVPTARARRDLGFAPAVSYEAALGAIAASLGLSAGG